MKPSHDAQTDTNTPRGIPSPFSDESPIDYAYRVGNWYITQYAEDDYAQVFTPPQIAAFMAKLVICESSNIKVLDPGAGVGILCCAVIEQFSRTHQQGKISLTAIEISSSAAAVLNKVLLFAQKWCSKKELTLEYQIKETDFLVEGLESVGLPSENVDALSQDFDLVIMNPPYFKVRSSDPRSVAFSKVVGRQSNIYSMFLSVGIHLLKSEGLLVSINPRSFTSGQYFRSFRQTFFTKMSLEHIHLFESRRDVFPNANVLQETMIILARMKKQSHTLSKITISTSIGNHDIKDASSITVKSSEVLEDNGEFRLAIPTSIKDIHLLEHIHEWTNTLHSIGLEISTGPVVPFRATKFLVYDKENTEVSVVPLLWMNNVTKMNVTWPLNNNKPDHIIASEGSQKLLLKNERYVLLRRFSAKEEQSRLVASVTPDSIMLSDYIGIENHLNFIHDNYRGLERNMAYGLAVLLNSSMMDRYFRIINGNTQVNAYDIRLIPLPNKEKIEEIGKMFLERQDEVADRKMIDDIVHRALGFNN